MRVYFHAYQKPFREIEMLKWGKGQLRDCVTKCVFVWLYKSALYQTLNKYLQKCILKRYVAFFWLKSMFYYEGIK